MKRLFRMTRNLMAMAALAATLLTTGCGMARVAHGGRAIYQDPNPVAPEAAVRWDNSRPSNGSLWTPTSASLWADDKARLPGDIVLVQVSQRNTATMKGDTDTVRKSSIGAKIRYFLGLEDEINTLTKYSPENDALRGTDGWEPANLLEASSSSTFEGSGATSRSDVFQATISTVVTDVLPNGNLSIYGHQTVELSNETSVLTVQGIVRPSDISSANTIDSTRIANAHIHLRPNGVISDNQHPGWAQRTFANVWPF